MFKWLARIWRKLFGPSLKTLNNDAKAIHALIEKIPAPDDEIISSFQILATKAKVFVDDNPAQKETTQSLLNEIIVDCFQKENFNLFVKFSHDSFSSFIADSKIIAEAANSAKKLAFLLDKGANIECEKLPPSEDYLVQTIRAWASTNPTNANFKPFLQAVYQDKFNDVCEHFQTAVDTGAFKSNLEPILTKMKKAVIQYFCVNNMLNLTLRMFFGEHQYKDTVYEKILNTPTVEQDKVYETKTIQKLREAYNERDNNEKMKIINSLLSAPTLDVFNQVTSSSQQNPPLEENKNNENNKQNTVFGTLKTLCYSLVKGTVVMDAFEDMTNNTESKSLIKKKV